MVTLGFQCGRTKGAMYERLIERDQTDRPLTANDEERMNNITVIDNKLIGITEPEIKGFLALAQEKLPQTAELTLKEYIEGKEIETISLDVPTDLLPNAFRNIFKAHGA